MPKRLNTPAQLDRRVQLWWFLESLAHGGPVGRKLARAIVWRLPTHLVADLRPWSSNELQALLPTPTRGGSQ